MNKILLILITAFINSAWAYFEQEQFLPSNPGLSEFFYLFKGEKYVNSIGPSIDSHWTPTEEQIEKMETVSFIGYTVVASTATYAIKTDRHVFYIFDSLTPIKKPEEIAPWTKVGNRWIVLRERKWTNYGTLQQGAVIVDIDSSVVAEDDDKGRLQARPLERTW